LSRSSNIGGLHLQKTLCADAFGATFGTIETWIMQKANRAFFKLNCRLLSSRIARSQLGIENEAPELPLINILGRV